MEVLVLNDVDIMISSNSYFPDDVGALLDEARIN